MMHACVSKNGDRSIIIIAIPSCYNKSTYNNEKGASNSNQ